MERKNFKSDVWVDVLNNGGIRDKNGRIGKGLAILEGWLDFRFEFDVIVSHSVFIHLSYIYWTPIRCQAPEEMQRLQL